jgi:aerobic carbon-monoxide dehydrogenase medium subunit
MIKEFEYLAPRKLKDALKMLDEHADDCKIVCGGQSILVMMRQGLVTPAFVIDIKGISELDYIKSDKDGMKIGAITTHRTIEKSAAIKKAYPALAQMEHRLASVQTRNRGSLGGNICHGEPAADPPPVLMALGASLKLSSVKGDRIVKVDDFYKDYFETVMEHNEMLVEIQIPAPAPFSGSAYSKFNIILNDLATVGVGVGMTLSAKNGVCKDVIISMGAMAPTARRAVKAEQVLRGNKITDKLLFTAGEVASEEGDPISDINASAEYRKEVCKVMVKHMAAEAYARANA